MTDAFFGLEKPHKISNDAEIDLLTTVTDNAMLAMIRGLLDDADIPYLVRERGSGGVVRIVTGISWFGTDIYVPTDALEEAKELIEGLTFNPDGDAEDVEDVEDATEETVEETTEEISKEKDAE